MKPFQNTHDALARVLGYLSEYPGIQTAITKLLDTSSMSSQHHINDVLQSIVAIVALPNFWERMFYGRPRRINNIIYFEQVVMKKNYVERPGGLILKLSGNQHLHIKVWNDNRSDNGDNYWQPIITVGIANRGILNDVDSFQWYAGTMQDIGNAHPSGKLLATHT